MNRQIETKMTSIRESWTEIERESRQDLAEVMQRELRQLMLRASRSKRQQTSDSDSTVASAC